MHTAGHRRWPQRAERRRSERVGRVADAGGCRRTVQSAREHSSAAAGPTPRRVHCHFSSAELVRRRRRRRRLRGVGVGVGLLILAGETLAPAATDASPPELVSVRLRLVERSEREPLPELPNVPERKPAERQQRLPVGGGGGRTRRPPVRLPVLSHRKRQFGCQWLHAAAAAASTLQANQCAACSRRRERSLLERSSEPPERAARVARHYAAGARTGCESSASAAERRVAALELFVRRERM